MKRYSREIGYSHQAKTASKKIALIIDDATCAIKDLRRMKRRLLALQSYSEVEIRLLERVEETCTEMVNIQRSIHALRNRRRGVVAARRNLAKAVVQLLEAVAGISARRNFDGFHNTNKGHFIDAFMAAWRWVEPNKPATSSFAAKSIQAFKSRH